MKSALSTIIVVLGAALLLLSFLWGLVFPSGQGWTDDKAARLADLTSQAHKLMFEAQSAQEKPSMHGGQSAAEVRGQTSSSRSLILFRSVL